MTPRRRPCAARLVYRFPPLEAARLERFARAVLQLSCVVPADDLCVTLLGCRGITHADFCTVTATPLTDTRVVGYRLVAHRDTVRLHLRAHAELTKNQRALRARGHACEGAGRTDFSVDIARGAPLPSAAQCNFHLPFYLSAAPVLRLCGDEPQ